MTNKIGLQPATARDQHWPYRYFYWVWDCL